jgi:HK97 family phage major capsid protein
VNLNELKASRQDMFAAAEHMVSQARAANKDLAGSELEIYKGLIASIKTQDKLIDQLAGHSAQDRPALAGPSNGVPPRASQFTTLRDALSHATPEQMEQVTALAAFLGGDIRAAADLTPAGDGGFIIPSIVQGTMERDYAQFAPVVSVARLWPTETGVDATFPVLSDSESGVQLAPAAATGADATVSGDTPPTDLTGPKLGAWKISSKPVFVPRETLTDSPIDIVTEILGALLARIIRYENLQYTSGDGTTEAEGFLQNCSHHAAGAVALDPDNSLDLAYAVPALYRPNGVYMMSDTTCRSAP